MTKTSSSIRQRRRLLNPPKTSAPSPDLTRPVGFVSPTVMEVDSNRAEIERLKRKISKYKKNDEDRRQSRKD